MHLTLNDYTPECIYVVAQKNKVPDYIWNLFASLQDLQKMYWNSNYNNIINKNKKTSLI